MITKPVRTTTAPDRPPARGGRVFHYACRCGRHVELFVKPIEVWCSACGIKEKLQGEPFEPGESPGKRSK